MPGSVKLLYYKNERILFAKYWGIPHVKKGSLTFFSFRTFQIITLNNGLVDIVHSYRASPHALRPSLICLYQMLCWQSVSPPLTGDKHKWLVIWAPSLHLCHAANLSAPLPPSPASSPSPHPLPPTAGQLNTRRHRKKGFTPSALHLGTKLMI